MATAALLRSGDVIGGFRIDDVIGIGGMAIVYRAEQISLGRPVALKVLTSKLTRDEVFRERFRREGTHAAGLEHPNIVPVYDSGEQDGNLYIAMRLVEGTNLAELIQTRGVTADQTIELLRPIASALDTAHAAGLIHRDVKPQNILITSHGHPYLADFGVAKGSNTEGLTATGGFVGSVHYASPEQIKGLTLTPASDVYALTAVLYQCLTGHVPFPRETDAGVMHAHLHDPPPTLPATSGADSDFHTVLARGMAKDPGARYGHAGDLINAAELCASRLPTESRKAVPAFPEPTESAEPAEPPVDAPPMSETEIVAADEFAAVRAAASFTAADRRRPAAPEPPAQDALTARMPKALIGGIAATLIAGAVLIVVLATGSSGDGRTKVVSTHVANPGPDPRVANELSRALGSRAKAVAAASAGVRNAHLSSRAGVLKTLAVKDEEAAHAVAGIPAPARDVASIAALAKGLGQETVLTRGLAAAALRDNAALYDSYRGRLMAARVTADGSGLSAIGFRGLPLPAVDIPRAPSPPHHRAAAPVAATPRPEPAVATQPSQPTYTAPPASTPGPPASTPSPAPRKAPEVIVSKPE